MVAVTLGVLAKQQLAQLHQRTCGGATIDRVDGGVAKLVHQQSALDGTTKLLLELHDGTMVEADELAELARGISQAVPDCKLLVNLIPYNDTLGGFKRHRSDCGNFNSDYGLWNADVYVHVRTTRGDDEIKQSSN